LVGFFEGMSPKGLTDHAIFWTVDRVKCFVLDLADSQFAVRRPAKSAMSKLAINWIEHIEQLDNPKAVSTHQRAFYRSINKPFPLDGIDLLGSTDDLNGPVLRGHEFV
jgi:hypothetical protein